MQIEVKFYVSNVILKRKYCKLACSSFSVCALSVFVVVQCLIKVDKFLEMLKSQFIFIRKSI
jgi:hypothetical protein